MRKLVFVMIAALGTFATASAFAYVISQNNGMTYSMMDSDTMGSMMGGVMSGMMGSKSMMNSGSGMNCNSMMSDVPQDVIIKTKSSQAVFAGKPQSMTLLVLDKETKKPLTNAQVIVGIEKGAPMSTMNMIGPMFDAENIGNGKYLVKFALSEKGYYTMHTHVIPAGKSMHSMMLNHEDIGIVVK